LLNVIPRFIQNQVVNRIRKGETTATAIFIDISGFTPMPEKLYSSINPSCLPGIFRNTQRESMKHTLLKNSFISLVPDTHKPPESISKVTMKDTSVPAGRPTFQNKLPQNYSFFIPAGISRILDMRVLIVSYPL
jgi:hypothetical protein